MKKQQQRSSDSSVRVFKGLVLVTALLISVMSPEMATADKYKSPDNSTPQEVADGMGTKFARGIANVATGWLEFPKQIYYTTSEDGLGKGIAVGPFKGLVMVLVRTVSGAAEILTFPVPYPGFYQPYFDPAYVWQKE